MKLLSLSGEWSRVNGGPLADDGQPAKELQPKPPPPIEGADLLASTGIYATVTDWILVQVQVGTDSDES
jgi:hypothetical protein